MRIYFFVLFFVFSGTAALETFAAPVPVVCGLHELSSSRGLTAEEMDFLELLHAAHCGQALRVELDRYAQLGQGSTGFREDEARRILGAIRALSVFAADLSLSSGQFSARTALADFIGGLKAYAGKYLENVRGNMARFDELMDRKESRLRARLAAEAERLGLVSLMSQDIDPLDEEIRTFGDIRRRDAFLAAADLLEEKKFDEALTALRSLSVQNTPLLPEHGAILLRMARALVHDNRDDPGPENEKNALALLAGLMDSGQYFSQLYDIYLLWRTLYQQINFGQTVSSKIPAVFYLERRAQVASVILARLAVEPRDRWARIQLFMLADLPELSPEGGARSFTVLGGE